MIEQAIAQHLASNGFGTIAQTLWVGAIPDGDDIPDAAVGIARYDGTALETFSSAQQQNSVQLFVRGAREVYSATSYRADQLWNFMVAIVGVEVPNVIIPDGEGGTINIGTVSLQAVRPRGTVIPLGRDASLRFQFSLNFEVTP